MFTMSCQSFSGAAECDWKWEHDNICNIYIYICCKEYIRFVKPGVSVRISSGNLSLRSNYTTSS